MTTTRKCVCAFIFGLTLGLYAGMGEWRTAAGIIVAGAIGYVVANLIDHYWEN